MTEPVWNARDQAQRTRFMTLLAPLVVASRCRDFDDPASAKTTLTVWMQALVDVPGDVLEAAVAQALPSVTWMPRPGELREVCAAVVAERRRAAARQAKALAESCDVCDGSGWQRPVIDGVEHVARCRCWTRGQALIAEAGAALSRPALLAASAESSDDASGERVNG